MEETRLVYSTERGGRVKERRRMDAPAPAGDGRVRVRYEAKGRKGKGMTIITGLAAAGAELEAIARKLKQRFGTGGAVKDGAIELQGDLREQLSASDALSGFAGQRPAQSSVRNTG